MHDYPIFKWMAVVMTGVSVVGTGIGAYFYIEDSRRAIKVIQEEIMEVAQQEAVRDGLWMDSDKQDQEELIRFFTRIDARFENIEDEHHSLTRAILDTKAQMLHSLGLHQGCHNRGNN